MDKDQILAHTFLPHCWVCETKFGPDCKKEDHHLVPQAYGGTNGPQVSLCDTHHSILHEIALKLYSKKPYYQLLPKDARQRKKLLYLASVVYNARVATENDPNKRQVLVFSPTKETLQQLAKLKTVYSKMSREAVVALAVRYLYTKHFR